MTSQLLLRCATFASDLICFFNVDLVALLLLPVVLQLERNNVPQNWQLVADGRTVRSQTRPQIRKDEFFYNVIQIQLLSDIIIEIKYIIKNQLRSHSLTSRISLL